MESVAPLVRAVVRAFYSDEYAVVIEPLLRDPYYLEDDERPRGPLSQKLGGISATRLRKILHRLENHSLIQRKEIYVQGSVVDVDEGDREGIKVKRNFYYIDFVHFVKIMTLRLSQIPESINSSQRIDPLEAVRYTCSSCEKSFDMIDASAGGFMCSDCLVPLDEQEQKSTSSTLGGSTQVSIDALIKKFHQQMVGETDQRDSINGFLRQAHNAGPNLPENDPAKRIQEQENDRKRQEALNKKAQEDVLEEEDGTSFTVKTEQKTSTLAPWLQMSSVTGQMTEEAILDAQERELKRNRLDQAEAHAVHSADVENDEYLRKYQQDLLQQQQKQQMQDENDVAEQPLSVPSTGNPDAVFTFKDGHTVLAKDINIENLSELEDRCTDEYEEFANFVQENTSLG